mmetsp:Transcript_15603/g.31627  ORF Transcript_15603/g.31627 Transcript_15603/m.31627 type:complete len:105 (+) Transcript_15603:397-711(+)
MLEPKEPSRKKIPQTEEESASKTKKRLMGHGARSIRTRAWMSDDSASRSIKSVVATDFHKCPARLSADQLEMVPLEAPSHLNAQGALRDFTTVRMLIVIDRQLS